MKVRATGREHLPVFLPCLLWESLQARGCSKCVAHSGDNGNPSLEENDDVRWNLHRD